MLLVAGSDAGRGTSDVDRAQDVVFCAEARRQGPPAAQRARAGTLRHCPVLRTQRLTGSQVTPSRRLLCKYTPTTRNLGVCQLYTQGESDCMGWLGDCT